MSPSRLSQIPRRGGSSSLGAVLVLLVVMMSQVLLFLPTATAAQQVIVGPTADAVLRGEFPVVVQVTPEDGEIIQAVDVQLAGPGERTVPLEFANNTGAEGAKQEWVGTVRPSEGLALANGAYTLTARTSVLAGDPTVSAAQPVRLAVPPPPRPLTAGPSAADATAVDLNWDAVTLPDFIAYRIQRRPDAAGGQWATVRNLTDPRQGSASDVVPQPGAYRYRLIVVRSDGGGAELFATSPVRGVRADPADPGTFEAPQEPAPEPANTPPPPAEGPRPVTRQTTDPNAVGAAATPTPGPTEAPTGQQPTAGNSGTAAVRPPQITRPQPRAQTPPAPAAPVAPNPGVVPLDDRVFDETLPFEATESEMVLTQTETAFLDGDVRPGGDLNIYTEDQGERPFAKAVAAGLLLLVISAHVRRFLGGGFGR